ncbi:MAG: protease inhibitor I42 family protein [Anaerolineae bacterium]
MRTFHDQEQAIRVAVDEAFAIALPGNPTTGYTWEADADDRCLELVDRVFEPGSEGVGAGGHEVFRFRALAAADKTEIGFEYKRPWDASARDTKRFRVVIR